MKTKQPDISSLTKFLTEQPDRAEIEKVDRLLDKDDAAHAKMLDERLRADQIIKRNNAIRQKRNIKE